MTLNTPKNIIFQCKFINYKFKYFLCDNIKMFFNCHFFLEDTIEKEVVINVDGKESHLIFIDYPHGEIQVEKTTFINGLQFQI